MQQAAEVKVGIFVVAVVALGVFIASSLKGGIAGGSRGYEFEIWFEAAPGVGKGSPARLAGVDIGEVVEKDIIQIRETVSFGVPTEPSLLPLELVKTWSHGREEDQDFVQITVTRRPISLAESRRIREFEAERSVARLTIRVRNEYQLYTRYNYEITGGIVFGDKQLNISDIGPDGLPLPAEQRGRLIPELLEQQDRVAVLGQSPASIDAIVGNVQDTVDDDTVRRIQQIVQNVETATGEASEMLAVLRTTIEANQGNADRMMSNFAGASEDVQSIMAEARAMTGQTLADVQQITATGRRIAGGNEARLNNVARNIEATSATFARLARTNETRMDQTMTDVAAVAREVRGMITSNRDSLDAIAARLAGSAENVQGLTGRSREQLEQILVKVDETMISVRDLLGDSDAQLASIINNTQAMVADSRATMGAVRESIQPITDNLRETSENLNTASRNVATLSSDPASRQILHNVERTTAEARELMSDIRGLTADPEVQQNLKETTRNVRSVSERIDNVFGGASSFEPRLSTDIYYVPDTSSFVSDVRFTLATKKKTSYHFGMDHVTTDPVLNGQLGRQFTDNLRVRYGFYRSTLGIGADYSLWDNAQLRTDLYDFNDPQFNTKFYYRAPFGFTGMIGVEDMFDRFDWTIGLQLGRDLR